MNTIGIVGLGLIGGSFAKAYHEAGWQVLACERDASVLSFAQISGAVNGVLDEKNITATSRSSITRSMTSRRKG